ncbi:predicted protein [Sclerotinia sclerotiorum 1980 UF-70]|uniref:Uncharacterized protein n=1 Tax=Sclerotinia sclerotiorum (strain ATCC 18683 / 1980 / Ss-1) TaxID=665079 RepID=A7F8T5_SCLS1|nr:predicted protein [Sclerotinia sclerotiorum 1980 UF-70]EDN99156.1 predicted protein [Sclerotinia sclerotiorum 1980 UF-70]
MCNNTPACPHCPLLAFVTQTRASKFKSRCKEEAQYSTTYKALMSDPGLTVRELPFRTRTPGYRTNLTSE